MAKGKKSGEKLSPFVPLLHQTLDCPAWRALGPHARLLYIALKRRARPETNGKVFLSTRMAADEIGAHRNTTLTAYRELQAKGFLEARQLGHLGRDGMAKATTWRLTELGSYGARPTKEFLAWSPGNDFPVVMGQKPAKPKIQHPATSDVHPRHKDRDVFDEPATTDVATCHKFCAVSAGNAPEPATTDVPHLESTRGGWRSWSRSYSQRGASMSFDGN